jgi:hypothetical protein
MIYLLCDTGEIGSMVEGKTEMCGTNNFLLLWLLPTPASFARCAPQLTYNVGHLCCGGARPTALSSQARIRLMAEPTLLRDQTDVGPQQTSVCRAPFGIVRQSNTEPSRRRSRCNSPLRLLGRHGFFGDGLTQRMGHRAVLFTGAGLGAIGYLIVVIATNYQIALAGYFSAQHSAICAQRSHAVPQRPPSWVMRMSASIDA